MIDSTPFYRFKSTIWLAVLLIVFGSCSVVKDYPIRQPFVYETNIAVESQTPVNDKKTLESQLYQQLDDSIRARKVDKLVGWEKGPRLFYSVLQNPPVYDSLNADKSLTYMKALLNAVGYYRDSITYNINIDSVRDQYRTTVNFKVNPGRLFTIDSVAYNIGRDSIYNNAETDSIEYLIQQSLGQSLIQKGKPFSKPLLSSERDRITDYFRNNGYLRFSQDEILVVWDTVGIALLRPTIDPIEQAQQFEALRQRRLNPTADVVFRLRANNDSSHLIKYHVGNVTIFPDLNRDTAQYEPTIRYRRRATIVSYYDQFRDRAVTENLYLRRGDVYSQQNYIRTINRYNSIGAWRLTTIDQIPRNGTDTVDFVVRLTPAAKYAGSINIEGSNNRSTLFTESNLVGLNLSLQNRNFARGANQATTTFRFAIDVNPKELAGTRQIAFGHVINFPRLIPRVPSLRIRENIRTSLVLNASNIVRDSFFKVQSYNFSWGYDYRWKNKALSIRLPNVEYSKLNKGRDLENLIALNKSYEFIFNDGLVISSIGNYTVTGSKTLSAQKSITTIARFNTELSGLLGGVVYKQPEKLYRFIKFDIDLRRTYNVRRSALAFRFFGGIGYEVMSKEDTGKRYLPFFKAYIAGGANSMRAWALRKLGPGSSNKSTARTDAPDRFGDIQLEFNGEYRFFIANMGGISINSALFTDIGNIWFLRNNPDFENSPGERNGQFQLDRLGRDLAMGLGTGLRIDFGPLLLRLDYAFKAKDPLLETNKQWFYNWGFGKERESGQLQLGVTYPF
jgi:outer membrane protein insertion porin family